MLLQQEIRRTFRVGHMACGIGSGAAGFNDADPRVGPLRGKFECAGGIDVDPGAIRNFEQITGAKGTVMDLFTVEQYCQFHGRMPPPGWKQATPADVRRAFGGYRLPLHCVFASFPCKGFSGLLSAKAAATVKYQALNGLTLHGMHLLLEAYKDDPVAILLFENVPRIETRGKHLVDQIKALLREYGYVYAGEPHDCGEVGNLAQTRKRYLMVARHVDTVPPFLYQPPKHKLRGVGEIIGQMPLPGDPVAGIMHRVPRLQWKTWVRLAFVEAGSDWRSLNRLHVENGVLRDYGIIPESGLRDNALGVNRWHDSAPVLTGQRAPGQGRFSVADPRAQGLHNEVPGVRTMSDHTGTIPGASRPYNGAHSVADPRPVDARWNHDVLGVRAMDETSGTIAGRTSPTNGTYSLADPRPDYGPDTHDTVPGVQTINQLAYGISGKPGTTAGAHAVADPRIVGHPKSVQLGVRSMDQPASVVKGKMDVGQGPYALADPRPKRPLFNNVFRIVPMDGPANAVTGPGGAGGASVADPRAAEGDYKKVKYKVTPYGQNAGAVIGASTTGTSAYAVADPSFDWVNAHRNKLRVIDSSKPAGTITGSDRVGSGAASVADPRPEAFRGGRDHYVSAGHYGVVAMHEHSNAVAGFSKHDRGYYSVADDRDFPDSTLPALPMPNEQLVARIISLDGTWHRPFTTLELAALQSIFDPTLIFACDQAGVWSMVADFDIESSSDSEKREWIGNAVPRKAARAMAETIGETLLLAQMGETFTLSSRKIWAKPLAIALSVDPRQTIFSETVQ